MSKFYKIPDGDIISLPDDEKVTIIVNGEEVEPLVPNTSDGAGEKHVPVVTVEDNKVIVNVGEVDHPMLDEHWINNIYLDTNKGFYAKSLKPGEKPNVVFVLDEDEVPEAAYEYCNLHGLWAKEF